MVYLFSVNTVFSYPVIITARQLDVFGHVNNAVYLQLYEDARWDFIEKGGYGHQRIVKDQLGPVILNLNLTFKKELRNQERIIIESTLESTKGSKLMIIRQVMIKMDKSVASSLVLTMGIMDLQKRRLITPPSDWMKAVGRNLCR